MSEIKNNEDLILDIVKQDTAMYRMGLEHGKGERMLIADFLKRIAIQDIDPNKTYIEVKIIEKNISKD